MNRLSLLLLFAPAFASAQVHYTLEPEPANKSVRITVTTEKSGDQVGYFFPAWVPGFYVILKSYQKVSDVKAVDASGKALKILPQTNPRRWLVENPTHGRVTLSYRVLGDDPGLGFFAVNVRPKTAFVLGAGAFMYVEGRKEEKTTLNVQNPAGWDISTSMNAAPDGSFYARDYDEFVDHPIDLGQMVKRQF
ncbi:MAG: hypothetical protein QOJ65_2264, partial [Fimbriimonadaceae bacterium]|nr:hypothetical protein [Fimbriimonadaceae bacterium]